MCLVPVSKSANLVVNDFYVTLSQDALDELYHLIKKC